MTPTVHCVRHAQGFHNLDPRNEESLFDPELTPRGRDQCTRLSKAFPYHSDIDFVISSPLRRTIQTTTLAFGDILSKRDLKVLLEPRCQETTSNLSDTGREYSDLFGEFGDIFDRNRLVDGWNSNTGRWQMNDENLKLNCAELKEYLDGLEHENVLLVAHGSVSLDRLG
jgi:broad specificity phosphatase PhoE